MTLYLNARGSVLSGGCDCGVGSIPSGCQSAESRPDGQDEAGRAGELGSLEATRVGGSGDKAESRYVRIINSSIEFPEPKTYLPTQLFPVCFDIKSTFIMSFESQPTGSSVRSMSHLFDNRYIQSIGGLTSPLLTEMNSRPNEASHPWLLLHSARYSVLAAQTCTPG